MKDKGAKNLNVIFEDNHLLVLFKPGGVPTQPTDIEEDSLETRGKAFIKEKYTKPGNVYLHAIHRLDKPVSGIVVFAKTSKALTRLQESIRKGECVKKYVAEVEGILKKEEDVLTHYLIHGEHIALLGNSKTGKLCRLKYKVKEYKEKSTVVLIELETGRYHQIRAQFSLIGHPVIGDKKYGSKRAYKEGEIALCHAEFEIDHPVSGKSHFKTEEVL